MEAVLSADDSNSGFPCHVNTSLVKDAHIGRTRSSCSMTTSCARSGQESLCVSADFCLRVLFEARHWYAGPDLGIRILHESPFPNIFKPNSLKVESSTILDVRKADSITYVYPSQLPSMHSS